MAGIKAITVKILRALLEQYSKLSHTPEKVIDSDGSGKTGVSQITTTELRDVQSVTGPKFSNEDVTTTTLSTETLLTSDVSTISPIPTCKYVIELSRWAISNDGSNPEATTSGINKAINWAYSNFYNYVELPGGTYMIDKDSNIALTNLNNLSLYLYGCTLQKQTNGYVSYYVLQITNCNYVNVYGGKLVGDRVTHNYSVVGTHEFGSGVNLSGNNKHILIKDLESCEMTGDAANCSYNWNYINQYSTETSCEMGKMDPNTGAKTTDANYIRTINPLPITSSIITTLGYFGLYGGSYGGWSGLQNRYFDVFFYDSGNKYLGSKTQAELYENIIFPEGASKIHVVLYQSTLIGGIIQIRAMEYSSNVIFENCDFHDCRRQALTLAGQNITVRGCNLYNIGGSTQKTGTDPQAGIDIEDGYEFNRNYLIENCKFYNNHGYHLVFIRTLRVSIRKCQFVGKPGKYVGVSPNGEDWSLEDCYFSNTNISTQGSGSFKNCNIVNTYSTFTGNLVTLEGIKFTDCQIGLSPDIPYSIRLSDCHIRNTRNKKYTNNLYTFYFTTNAGVWAANTSYNNSIEIISGVNKYRSTTSGKSTGTIPNFLTDLNATVDDTNGLSAYASGVKYTTNQVVLPSTRNGYYYVCTTASGVVSTIEPTWSKSTEPNGNANLTTDIVGNKWTTQQILVWKNVGYPVNPCLIQNSVVEGDDVNYLFSNRTDYRDIILKNVRFDSISKNLSFPNGTYDNCHFTNILGVPMLFGNNVNTDVTITCCHFEIATGMSIQGKDIVMQANTLKYITALQYGKNGITLTRCNSVEITNNILVALLNSATNFGMIVVNNTNTGRVIVNENTIVSGSACPAIDTSSNAATTNAIIKGNRITKATLSKLKETDLKSGNIVDGVMDPYNFMEIAPESGYYILAQKVYKSIPTSAGYEGWICTAAGYVNNITWTTGKKYTLNQRVTSGTNVYQCSVVGAGISSNQPNGTNASTVVYTDGYSWRYIGPLAVFKTFGVIS